MATRPGSSGSSWLGTKRSSCGLVLGSTRTGQGTTGGGSEPRADVSCPAAGHFGRRRWCPANDEFCERPNTLREHGGNHGRDRFCSDLRATADLVAEPHRGIVGLVDEAPLRGDDRIIDELEFLRHISVQHLVTLRHDGRCRRRVVPGQGRCGGDLQITTRGSGRLLTAPRDRCSASASTADPTARCSAARSGRTIGAVSAETDNRIDCRTVGDDVTLIGAVPYDSHSREL
jgi:hypothetical protein